VGLIEEADVGGNVRERLPIEDAGAGNFQAAPDHVSMRRNPEDAAERAGVIVPTASLWAGAGGALGALLARGPARRAVGVGMALLLAATVVEVWI
jgi:hypothetical protein